MKILYLSVLSVVILGQAYCDFHQAKLAELSRAQSTAAQNELQTKFNNALDEIQAVKESYALAFDEALKNAREQFKEEVEQRCEKLDKQFAQRSAGLEEQFKDGSDDLQKFLTETENLTESQTNHVVSVINKLRLGTLGRLHDLEANVASLKKQQVLAVSDQEFLRRQKQKSATQSDPD